MANPQNYGLFVPTTNVWDVGQLESIEVTSPEFKRLLVRLYQDVNTIGLALNIKDSAYYDTSEFVNGQLYFPNPANNSQTNPYIAPAYRQVFRTVINFGALPAAAGTKSVAHNITITPATTFTRIYAVASDTTNNSYIPIPYSSVSALANNIELSVDATNVNITVGINRSTYTIVYVVLEYLQS